MLQKFEQYLKNEGYSILTPSNNPSTVYDYKKRVKKICERENIDIERLSENIDFYIKKYDLNGKEETFGKKSHSSYINALKRLKEFINKV